MPIRMTDGSTAVGLGTGSRVTTAPDFKDQIRQHKDPNMATKLANSALARRLSGKRHALVQAVAMTASQNGPGMLRRMRGASPSQLAQLLKRNGNDLKQTVEELDARQQNKPDMKPSPSAAPSPSGKKRPKPGM